MRELLFFFLPNDKLSRLVNMAFVICLINIITENITQSNRSHRNYNYEKPQKKYTYTYDTRSVTLTPLNNWFSCKVKSCGILIEFLPFWHQTIFNHGIQCSDIVCLWILQVSSSVLCVAWCWSYYFEKKNKK